MRLCVLGPVELRDATGEPLPLGGPRQEILLAVLSTAANRIVPVGRLRDLLWPDGGPRDPDSALHNQVWRLRRTLAGAGLQVVRRHAGYQLVAEERDVDAARFEALVKQTPEAATADRYAALLAHGLGLWRGEPYLGLDGIPVLRHESGRLTELRLSWLERITDRLLTAGDPATAAAYLGRTVAEAPLRERSRVLLMRALAAAGRTTDAVTQYHAFRERHVAETGLEPGPDLQAAYRRLLRGDEKPRGSSGGPPGELPSRPAPCPLPLTPVPAPASPIVGRDAELDQLRDLRDAGHRLISLTGPGGVGKSRLATELAHRAGRGEVGLVDLARLAGPEEVPDAFARALGVPPGTPDLVTELATAVGEREVLLVVDGFETVLPAAGFVGSLLSGCPGLTVVVTSRERLDLPGETEYAVRPLAVPGPDAGPDEALRTASVALFRQRVPDPVVSGERDETAVRIGHLCRELGGLPLAIELAAARATYRSVTAVCDDLVRSVASGGDTAPGPLESALRWSYRRLPPAQQRVLRRLCGFRGGFDPAAAAAVCGGDRAELAEVLDRLVALGFLITQPGEAGGRYAVPRIPAGYLWRRTDPAERADVEVAHLAYYAGQCRDPRYLDDQLLARLDAGYPDFLAALDRALAGDSEPLCDLALALSFYWLWRDQPEPALRWLDRVADRLGDAPPRLARIDVQRAIFLRSVGRAEEAAQLTAAAVTVLAAGADPEWLLTGHAVLAALADDRGDAATAVRHAEVAVATARAGAPRRLAESLGYLALACVSAGDPARAADVAREALTRLDAVESWSTRAATRSNATQALIEAGHATVAREVLASGLAELAGTPSGIAAYQINLGWAHLATGDHAGALGWFRGFLARPGPAGQWRWVTEAVAGSACALWDAGQAREAALALGGAERLMDRFDLPLSPWMRRRLDAVYAAVGREPRGRELVQAGAQLTADAVLRLVAGETAPAGGSVGL